MTTQTPDCKPRALIAMSGGVDSSVAAWLMQQAGYDCTGITMRLTRNDPKKLCHRLILKSIFADLHHLKRQIKQL